MKYPANFFMIAALVLLLAGCDASVMEAGDADVTLNVNAHVNGKAFSTNAGTSYDINGATVSFASARMYISEITLINSDGEQVTLENEPLSVPAKNDADKTVTHAVKDRVLLVKHDANTTAYDIGTWPAGDYTGIRFKVGVAGMTNRIDPSQVPARHALAKQTDVNNHWNWKAGYLFLRMDGTLDTDNLADTNGDDIPDNQWAVHLGTAKFLREVALAHSFTLKNETPATLDISVDYAEFFKNVDLENPDQRVYHTMNNIPVATAVANQISSAFKIGRN